MKMTLGKAKAINALKDAGLPQHYLIELKQPHVDITLDSITGDIIDSKGQAVITNFDITSSFGNVEKAVCTVLDKYKDVGGPGFVAPFAASGASSNVTPPKQPVKVVTGTELLGLLKPKLQSLYQDATGENIVDAQGKSAEPKVSMSTIMLDSTYQNEKDALLGPDPHDYLAITDQLKHPVLKYPVYPVSKMGSGPKILLKDAVALYQPVSASSAGSRYFLVGACPKLRVAARYKGSVLSVRAEGAGVNTMSSTLHSVGLSAGGKDYFSAHFTVTSKILAAKTLGAVLVGLGLPYDSPIPNMNIALTEFP